jgi:hypothetical protein
MLIKHFKLFVILIGIFYIISQSSSQVNSHDTSKINNNYNTYVNDNPTNSNRTINDIILLLIGSIIGFCFSILGDIIRNRKNKSYRKQKGEQLIKSILNEIEQGINRCDYLIKMKSEGKISFSRIYVSLWQSMQVDVSNYIYEFLKDPNTLKHIHSIYYTFDLINFNMEREQFDVGAAFAHDHRKKIEDEYDMLMKNLHDKKINI